MAVRRRLRIIWNGKGQIVALYPLMPNRMRVDRDAQGQLKQDRSLRYGLYSETIS